MQLELFSEKKAIQLRPYQQEALDSIPESGAFVICMAVGLGKCFAPGTPVLMYNGDIKPVEQIREGELVMGADSKPRRVSGLAHGMEEMFKVTPVKGEPYVVNASHILSLKITRISNACPKHVTDSRGRRYTGGDICNISVRDYLKCSSHFKHMAKGWRTGVDFSSQNVKIPPYILGVWLGDGNSRATTITTMDDEVVDAFTEYCEANSLIIRPALCQSSGKAITYLIKGKYTGWGCNKFKSELEHYQLIQNKHIPHEYLINDWKTRIELLAGLLDADGYIVDRNVFEIATSREAMRDGILFLARSLGFAAYSANKIVNGKIYYRINISGDMHLIPTRIPRRKASVRKQKKNVLHTGIKVEPVGVGEYFGFELEGTDRLFLLGDFTVVHNTVTFSRIPRRGRMLILSHRDELVHQPEKYFDCSFGVEQGSETSHGEEVISASVQSLVHRLDKFRPDEFDVLITDECFPAGTMVDGVPIENIQEGDYVTAFNHAENCFEKRKVLRVFKRIAPAKMIRINHELVCTTNHPIYEARTRRYVSATNIQPGDSILHRVWQNRVLGQNDKASTLQIPQDRPCILFGKMHEGVLPEDFIRDDEANQQKVCIRQNEGSQSYERCESTGENVSNFASNKTQTENTGRKWTGNDNSAGVINGSSYVIEAGKRVCSENICEENQCRTLPFSLQSGHSNSRENDCHRGRWNESYVISQEGTGCKEREIFEVQRVDSIEVLEYRNLAGCNNLCPDGYVYNLEVEGLNNYFANGVLVHNCHHSTAPTYRKIYDYFKPRLHLGFTATPNRNDGVGLKAIYSDIIYERNLRWGIENGYLSNIHCLRVDIGVDLRRVAQRLGDYAPDSLDRAINIESANEAVAEAYRLYAKPPALIFCASVAHAEALAEKIPGAVAVKGGEDRSETVQAFSEGKIPCLTNCMVFTEGTDIPNIQTVIMARPTRNVSLYIQAIGRGCRLYPGKEYLTLIDCVGISEDADLCTAPSLLGLDIDDVPPEQRYKLQGNLFDIPEIITELEDSPEAWIRNVESVDLWARKNKYDMHGVNYFRMPDGSLILSEPRMVIPAEDSLGRILWKGRYEPAQKVFDEVYNILRYQHSENRALWDLNLTRHWGNTPATEKQKALIRRNYPEFDVSTLTKFEAGQILTRHFAEPPTEKQKHVLRRAGYDIEGLSKYDAIQIIRRLKGA